MKLGVTMGWLRLVNSLKLKVSFAEYCLFHRALLQKETYNCKKPTTCSHPIGYLTVCDFGKQRVWLWLWLCVLHCVRLWETKAVLQCVLQCNVCVAVCVAVCATLGDKGLCLRV